LLAGGRTDQERPASSAAVAPGAAPERGRSAADGSGFSGPAAGAVTSPTSPMTSVSLPVTTPAINGPSPTAATTASSDPPLPVGEAPRDLGDDVALNALATDCYRGDMGACDELFLSAPSGSRYRRFGDTCAGRQAERTGLLCVTAFGDRAPTST
jgi:hypothetical protein